MSRAATPVSSPGPTSVRIHDLNSTNGTRVNGDGGQDVGPRRERRGIVRSAAIPDRVPRRRAFLMDGLSLDSAVSFDWFILLLRIAFIALIYLFLFQVSRVSLRELIALGSSPGQRDSTTLPDPSSALEVVDAGESSLSPGHVLPTRPLHHRWTNWLEFPGPRRWFRLRFPCRDHVRSRCVVGRRSRQHQRHLRQRSTRTHPNADRQWR